MGSYLASLSFSFLICKLGILPPSMVVWKVIDKMYKAFTWYVEYSRYSINGVKIVCIKWQRAITVETRKLRITSRLGYLRIYSYLKEMKKNKTQTT